MTNIQLAISASGGAKKLAQQIGVPIQSVYFWQSGKRRVPANYCPSIERVTGIRCEELRPDVEWGVLRGNPTPQPQAA